MLLPSVVPSVLLPVLLPVLFPVLVSVGCCAVLFTVTAALAPPKSTGLPSASPADLTVAVIVQVPAPTAEKVTDAEFGCPAASPITTTVSFPPDKTAVLSTLKITSTPYPDGHETVAVTEPPTFTVLALKPSDTPSAFTVLSG